MKRAFHRLRCDAITMNPFKVCRHFSFSYGQMIFYIHHLREKESDVFIPTTRSRCADGSLIYGFLSSASLRAQNTRKLCSEIPVGLNIVLLNMEGGAVVSSALLISLMMMMTNSMRNLSITTKKYVDMRYLKGLPEGVEHDVINKYKYSYTWSRGVISLSYTHMYIFISTSNIHLYYHNHYMMLVIIK